jgi:hypothetical protein
VVDGVEVGVVLLLQLLVQVIHLVDGVAQVVEVHLAVQVQAQAQVQALQVVEAIVGFLRPKEQNKQYVAVEKHLIKV